MPSSRLDETLNRLREAARAASAHAYVPYSGRPAAAALLLSDGQWVPGVRVESASFSLLIPALLNAFTTAVAAGRPDVVAVVLDHAFLPEEVAFMRSTPEGRFAQVAPDAFVRGDGEAMPPVGPRLSPFLDDPPPDDPEAGIALARQVAERAHIPASAFPVGCVLVTDDGHLVPGVNVEHADWARILCAERNALGTARTYGLGEAEALYLTCLKDPAGTPCGACRQLLSELAPAATLWMDRGQKPPEATTPPRLLPGAFTGKALVTPDTTDSS